MCHELKRAGFDEPFEVQRETIPDMMLGRDVCCRAPTGSGKTLAFGIPMLERVGRGEPSLPKALILTPTRELAEQIHGVLDPIAWGLNLKIMPIYGGVSYSKQIRRLDRGVDIVVACPGRLLDLIDRENVFLDEVEIVILDEADRMADMGFTEPVCQILEECSPKRQTIMFSATLDEEVAEIRDKYQTAPQIIEIGPEEVSVTEMNHHFWLMPNSMKSRISAEAIVNLVVVSYSAVQEQVLKELQMRWKMRACVLPASTVECLKRSALKRLKISQKAEVMQS